MGDSPDWLAEQVDYYRRRAGEYDATVRPPGDPLAEQDRVLRGALREFEPRGRVLELARGTGLYTRELVPFADSITALDASPEMLDAARRRVRSPTVRFLHADVFSWEPDGRYDVVFFSFWLSHVPPRHFERFWDRVAAFLAPGGRVFFMDEGRHTHWQEEFVDEAAGVVRRQLLDGSEHHAIKVLWDAAELQRRLGELGWNVSVTRADAFYWGHGRRAT
ncbi:MAG: class I SAM-dependent methyltransferase [Actinomycetota bacterium]|nr:class I SAM-dependent methyltransferase [Actinomycetota bacterium]